MEIKKALNPNLEWWWSKLAKVEWPPRLIVAGSFIHTLIQQIFIGHLLGSMFYFEHRGQNNRMTELGRVCIMVFNLYKTKWWSRNNIFISSNIIWLWPEWLSWLSSYVLRGLHVPFPGEAHTWVVGLILCRRCAGGGQWMFLPLILPLKSIKTYICAVPL